MKQLLFLLLFPCLAMAQYSGNAGQKITLGEQTTADGLVWRGRTTDTVNLMTNKIDTSAYLVLDTITEAIWLYRASTTPKWNRVVDSLNNLQGQLLLTTKVTGVLPVANGGTNTSTLTANKVMVGNGTSGVLTPTDLHWDNSTAFLGVGEPNPTLFKFTVKAAIPALFNSTDTRNDITYGGTRYYRNVSTNGAGNGFQMSFNDNLNNIAEYCYIGGYIIDNTSTSKDGGILFMTTNNNVNRQEVMRLINNGNVGIGQTTPTAVLHLKAGTATAAPIRLTSSGATLLSSLESGAVEFNGTNLLFTPSTTRHTVNHGLTGSATLDFPLTTTLLSADLTITVTGAADGDVVSLGVPNAAVNANTCYTAWVSAANTVTVRFNNYSSGTINPASGTFKVFVTK